ncbi:MAG: PQQ-dependent sugar dehydrogenase [Gemmatimonadota bacterium]
MKTCNALFGTAVVLAIAAVGCTTPENDADVSDGGDAECTPLETRPANAPDQRPAFESQTRTCGIASSVAIVVDVIATGLEHPWAVEPLPTGELLITERPGRMRIISAAGEVGAPLAGLPEVDAARQGGLLDVALSPSFDADRAVYWSYAEPRSGGNGTAVARGVLSADRHSLEQVQVIFRAMPTYDGGQHFGSRLAFGPDGMLYITLGDRSDRPMRAHAQRLDSHLGKIVRIAPDGSVPADNPFAGSADALPEIWTLGHRNVQAASFNEDGQLWAVEHGTRGGDELNLIEKGRNYGWPVVAYGIEYSGDPITGAATQRPDGDYQQPVYYWDPVIAPSGAQFYTGSAFPEWRGSLFIGSLRELRLVRLTLEGDRVTGEEHLLADREHRVRDVRQGLDGALYVVTDMDDGELWRLRPER